MGVEFKAVPLSADWLQVTKSYAVQLRLDLNLLCSHGFEFLIFCLCPLQRRVTGMRHHTMINVGFSFFEAGFHPVVLAGLGLAGILLPRFPSSRITGCISKPENFTMSASQGLP